MKCVYPSFSLIPIVDVILSSTQGLTFLLPHRCMFLHHQRLRYAAIGFQLVWRGYFVRTRYRVKEKVLYGNQAGLPALPPIHQQQP